VRTLITLSVLQTIGIAVLVVHALREEPHAVSDVRPAQSPASAPAPVEAPRIDEARLRAILREELAQEHNRPVAESLPAAPSPAPPHNPSAAELQQRDLVAQQIEAYRAVGMITDAQMQELQADIAKLDAVSRKQMLSKLTRALNTGDIKGRL